MGKFKACLSFISPIPAPFHPSSSLSSFLSNVFCVFGSISLRCLDRTTTEFAAHDPNIKPSEILRLTKKGWNAHNLYIWPTGSQSLWHIIRQTTDIPPIVDRYSTDNQWSNASVDISRSMYRPMYTIDRGIGRVLVDMSTDISTEGCTYRQMYRKFIKSGCRSSSVCNTLNIFQ